MSTQNIRVAKEAISQLPLEAKPGEAVAYTDGACSGNPGPAGLGVVLMQGDQVTVLSEYLGDATNNVAELSAIGRAAEASAAELPLRVFTDSTYAIGVLSGQMKAKKNRQLIDQVRSQLARHPEVVLCHVPAHSGVELNERADDLAVQAVRDRASQPWQSA